MKDEKKMYPVEILWKIKGSPNGDILLNAGKDIPDDSLDDNPRHRILAEIIRSLESLAFPMSVTLILGLAANLLWVEVSKIQGISVSGEQGSSKLFVRLFVGTQPFFDRASNEEIKENFLMGFKSLLEKQIPVKKNLSEFLMDRMNEEIAKAKVMEFILDNFPEGE